MMALKYTLFILSAILTDNVKGVPAPHETSCETHGENSLSTLSIGTVTSTLTFTSTDLVTSVITAPFPTSTNRTSSEGNVNAGVFICENHSWGGKCEYKQSAPGSGPDNCIILDGKTSSVGPDKGFKCIFYTSSNCRSLQDNDSIGFTWPGNSNLLVTPKGDFNDKLHSYHCFKLEE